MVRILSASSSWVRDNDCSPLEFKRKTFWIFQRIQLDVDVQVWPMKAVERTLEIVDLGNCGIMKIGIIFKRHKVFPSMDKQPEPIVLNAGYLGVNLGNVCSRH